MKNLFPATFEDTKAMVDDLKLHLQGAPERGKRYVAIRAEDIVITKEKPSGNGINVFGGKVLELTDRGIYHEVSVSAGNVIFRAILTKSTLFEMKLPEGKDVYVAIQSSAIHVFSN